MRAKLLKLIFESIDELNETLSPDEKIQKCESTILTGPSTTLGSMELTLLIVNIEHRCLDQLDLAINFYEISQSTGSPFPETIGSLINTVLEFIS